MTNIKRLDNVDHAALRVMPGHRAEYGDSVNLCLLFPTEFEMAQREYVILVQKDGNGAFQSVALLGLDRDENLFLDDGRWNARYIPAIHRRGPFMIGYAAQEVDGEDRREPVIHIDTGDVRVTEAEGYPLFLTHGGNAPYLEHVTLALQMIHDGVALQSAMFAALERYGLLEPAKIEIGLSDTEQYRLEDYYTIDQDRLAALDGDALADLNRSGHLRLAYQMLSSLGNADYLVRQKRACMDHPQ